MSAIEAQRRPLFQRETALARLAQNGKSVEIFLPSLCLRSSSVAESGTDGLAFEEGV